MKSNTIHLIGENVETYFYDPKVKENVLLRRPEKYRMWRKNEIGSKKKLKVSIQLSTSQGRLIERWQPLIFVMSKTGRLFNVLVLILLDLKTPLLLKIIERPKKQMHSHLILGTHTHKHIKMLIVLNWKYHILEIFDF